MTTDIDTLATLAVMQALLGYTSEARWLHYAHDHLGHLFRYLPQQSGRNKRLRKAAELIKNVIRALAVDTTLWTDDVRVVDSTVPAVRDRHRRQPPRSWPPPWSRTDTGGSPCCTGLVRCAPPATARTDPPPASPRRGSRWRTGSKPASPKTVATPL